MSGIVAETLKSSVQEKREYPRIKANCPVRFQLESENIWHQAILVDYSAMGAQILCDDLILKGTKVRIEILPGNKRNIPAIKAEGVVVRNEIDEEHHFHIGCQFLKIIHSLLQK